MNRIDKKFVQLKEQKKKAFIAFITAGDPDLATTERLVLAFERSGVDIVELGVPFSDPLADGPTIQAASQRALERGVTLKKILKLVQRLRTKTELPICLMTYYNPVFRFGEKAFAAAAAKAGVDGLIVPDLPPEEARKLIAEARRFGLATIFFLSPTTDPKRVAFIDQSSRGFIYYVSVAGVTGARTKLPKTLTTSLRSFQKKVSKPVCVGFGISTPQQVKEIAKDAGGVIVGSAIVKEILRNKGQKNLVNNVARFVRSLSKHV